MASVEARLITKFFGSYKKAAAAAASSTKTSMATVAAKSPALNAGKAQAVVPRQDNFQAPSLNVSSSFDRTRADFITFYAYPSTAKVTLQ